MVQSKCLRGDQADDQMNLVGCSTGKSAGFAHAKPFDVLGAALKQRREICSIGYKTAHFDMLAETMHRRQLRTHRQNAELVPIGGYEWITHYVESLYTILECVIAVAISLVCRISNVVVARPTVLAADCTSRISNTAAGAPIFATIPNRRKPGRTSRKISTRLPATSVAWSDRPVALPSGRVKLATTPLPIQFPKTGEDDWDDRCRPLRCEHRFG